MSFQHVTIGGLQYALPVSTTSDGRYYTTPEGNHYPSASTIAGLLSRDAIEKWRKRVGAEAADKKTRRGANRGTAVHYLCEKYLQSKMTLEERLGMMPTHKELFLQLRRAFDKHIDFVYAVEQSLYSDRLKIAGRTDAAVRWDSEGTILDLKTSGYAKPEEWITGYFVQCAAYAEMWEERTGMPINQIVVAMAVEDDPNPVIFKKDKAAYLPILDQCIAQFYAEAQGQLTVK